MQVVSTDWFSVTTIERTDDKHRRVTTNDGTMRDYRAVAITNGNPGRSPLSILAS